MAVVNNQEQGQNIVQLTGAEFGGCRLDEPIGAGAWGSVYLATQLSMERQVAVKVMNPQAVPDANAAERFFREARLAAQLNHTNIVQVFDVGRSGDFLFLVMEYIKGDTLLKVFRDRGGIPLIHLLPMIIGCCHALEHARGINLVHRDIKPQNILIGPDGTPKIADFGLAKRTSGSGASGTLTFQGQILGTPHYMSPEQARDSKDVDHRTDIYSLGATFYRTVYGAPPYQGDSAMTIISKVLYEDPPFPSVNDTVDRLILPIIQKMMAKDVEDRYQTAGEAAGVLEAAHREILDSDDAREEVSKVFSPGASSHDGGPTGGEATRKVPVPKSPSGIGMAIPRGGRPRTRRAVSSSSSNGPLIGGLIGAVLLGFGLLAMMSSGGGATDDTDMDSTRRSRPVATTTNTMDRGPVYTPPAAMKGNNIVEPSEELADEMDAAWTKVSKKIDDFAKKGRYVDAYLKLGEFKKLTETKKYDGLTHEFPSKRQKLDEQYAQDVGQALNEAEDYLESFQENPSGEILRHAENALKRARAMVLVEDGEGMEQVSAAQKEVDTAWHSLKNNLVMSFIENDVFKSNLWTNGAEGYLKPFGETKKEVLRPWAELVAEDHKNLKLANRAVLSWMNEMAQSKAKVKLRVRGKSRPLRGVLRRSGKGFRMDNGAVIPGPAVLAGLQFQRIGRIKQIDYPQLGLVFVLYRFKMLNQPVDFKDLMTAKVALNYLMKEKRISQKNAGQYSILIEAFAHHARVAEANRDNLEAKKDIEDSHKHFNDKRFWSALRGYRDVKMKLGHTQVVQESLQDIDRRIAECQVQIAASKKTEPDDPEGKVGKPIEPGSPDKPEENPKDFSLQDLFKGRVKDLGKGSIEVTYDFSDESQMEDFIGVTMVDEEALKIDTKKLGRNWPLWRGSPRDAFYRFLDQQLNNLQETRPPFYRRSHGSVKDNCLFMKDWERFEWKGLLDGRSAEVRMNVQTFMTRGLMMTVGMPSIDGTPGDHHFLGLGIDLPQDRFVGQRFPWWGRISRKGQPQTIMAHGRGFPDYRELKLDNRARSGVLSRDPFWVTFAAKKSAAKARTRLAMRSKGVGLSGIKGHITPVQTVGFGAVWGTVAVFHVVIRGRLDSAWVAAERKRLSNNR